MLKNCLKMLPEAEKRTTGKQIWLMMQILKTTITQQSEENVSASY